MPTMRVFVPGDGEDGDEGEVWSEGALTKKVEEGPASHASGACLPNTLRGPCANKKVMNAASERGDEKARMDMIATRPAWLGLFAVTLAVPPGSVALPADAQPLEMQALTASASTRSHLALWSSRPLRKQVLPAAAMN